MKYDDEEVLGNDLRHTVGRNELSFGMIVALTGDFIGDYTLGIGEVDQLSDTWDTWPTNTVLRMVPKLAERLSNDREGIVERVINIMKNKRGELKSVLDCLSVDQASVMLLILLFSYTLLQGFQNSWSHAQ